MTHFIVKQFWEIFIQNQQNGFINAIMMVMRGILLGVNKQVGRRKVSEKNKD
jgi:hypothetical protein